MALGNDVPHLTAETERVAEKQTRSTNEWITGQIPVPVTNSISLCHLNFPHRLHC
jgi:hypothetical protein